MKGAEKASESIGQQIGKEGWKKARALWDRLRSRIGEESPAVQEVAEAPQDADAQAALRVAIKQVLKADPALAEELRALLDEARAAVGAHVAVHGNQNVVAQGTGAVAAGDRGVAIGGSVSGAVISTGDSGSGKR